MTRTYEKNLSLLRERFPELHDTLLRHRPEILCQEISTPGGEPTLLCISANTEPCFLHSPDDPAREASSLIEDYEFRGEDITILLGFGLGYLPLAIARRMDPEHRLFVVEARPEILLKACQLIDLSTLFSDDRVHVFGTNQVQLIWDELERDKLKLMAGQVLKLIHPPSRRLFPEAYRNVEDRIERFVCSIKSTFHFVEAIGSITVENIFTNLLALADSAPVDTIFGVAKGHPALVVAAGPSLDKNIRQIKDVEGRFLIIAVDAALKPLMAKGIRPNLVVSVDPNPINLKKFDQIPSRFLNEVPLLFSPDVYHEIPRRFPGTKFVFGEHNPLSRWGVGLARKVAEFPHGFSVSHYAFYLARAMEAEPIIFAGLDLALSGTKDHAQDCAVTWHVDPAGKDLPTVPGVYGDRVTTIGGFINMITLFERQIAFTDARCIDATEGGALIPGTQVMTLKETIDLCGHGGCTDFTELFQKIWSENRLKDRTKLSDRIKEGLTWLMDQADEVRICCEAARPILSSLLDDLECGQQAEATIAEKIRRVNQIADQISNHREFTKLIGDWMREVSVKKYRMGFELERTSDEDRKLCMEVELSHLFVERLTTVVETIKQFGVPVLESL